MTQRSLLAILLCLGLSHLWAQTKIKTVNDGELDFAVPDSPAFTVLGVNPTTIARPTTPSELASSVINGVDKNGNFQTGLALDFSPYMLGYGGKVGINTYNQGCKFDTKTQLNRCRFSMLRFAARSQISIGTLKGSSAEDKSMKLALGFHFTLFDFGDPRLDRSFLFRLDNAIQIAMDNVKNKRIAKGLSDIPRPDDAAGQAQFIMDQNAELKRLIAASINGEKKSNWNRSSWTIAAAPTFSSVDGTISNMGWNGAGVWTNVGYGFEQVPGLNEASQLVGYFEYRDRESVAATTTVAATTQNSIRTGGKWVFGTNDFHASAECLYVDARPQLGTSQKYVQTTIAAEKKLADKLWFHVGVGGQGGRSNRQNQFFILSSFNWGSSQESKIAAGQ